MLSRTGFHLLTPTEFICSMSSRSRFANLCLSRQCYKWFCSESRDRFVNLVHRDNVINCFALDREIGLRISVHPGNVTIFSAATREIGLRISVHPRNVIHYSAANREIGSRVFVNVCNVTNGSASNREIGLQTPCSCRQCYKMFCMGTDFSARRVDLVCPWNLVICLPKFSQNRCWKGESVEGTPKRFPSLQECSRTRQDTDFNMKHEYPRF